MLEVRNLSVHHGRAQLLFDLSFSARAGEVLVLVGRNGAGKSTTLKAIMGLLPEVAGSVRFAGDAIGGRAPHHIARMGLGYVPEERRIFSDLTVAENLEVGRLPVRAQVTDAPRWSVDRVCALFPKLGEMLDRPGGQMSGGEQQMLTLCRTLMGDPDLIMIDEPTEGLAPKIVELVAEYLKELKNRGVSVLLVEQKLTIALEISGRCYVMGHGSIVFEGTPAELRANDDVRKEWLEV